MNQIVFVIIVTPANKHRLLQRMVDGEDQPIEIDRGLYDTHTQALEAMDRIIKPVTSYYDKDGEPVT